MTASENPVRKQQAAGWRVFKAAEPVPGGNALYVCLVDPGRARRRVRIRSCILAESLGAERGHAREPGDAQEVRGCLRELASSRAVV